MTKGEQRVQLASARVLRAARLGIYLATDDVASKYES
jgi:hypothetical protein